MGKFNNFVRQWLFRVIFSHQYPLKRKKKKISSYVFLVIQQLQFDFLNLFCHSACMEIHHIPVQFVNEPRPFFSCFWSYHCYLSAGPPLVNCLCCKEAMYDQRFQFFLSNINFASSLPSPKVLNFIL